MASGLLALLDDVIALAKLAAASVDDVALQTGRAVKKATGIVVDDAAVTPKYVVGFASERELPIIRRIAVGSLRNKLLFLLPGALLLSQFAAWAITPLLMLGGTFLCFEGAEKVLAKLARKPTEAAAEPVVVRLDEAAEAERVRGAVRTDLILSAEIMAIALATVTEQSSALAVQAAVLFVVSIGITVLVYGTVALIVKADDAGAALARGASPGLRALGHAIVNGMPFVLGFLSILGTAAMLWVGGDILVHGLSLLGEPGPEQLIKDTAARLAAPLGPLSGAAAWVLGAAAGGLLGLIVGALVIPVVHFAIAPLVARFRARGA